MELNEVNIFKNIKNWNDKVFVFIVIIRYGRVIVFFVLKY